jgi:hypothetical protein
MTETRKLAAILVADVVGYSRLAGTDEERTLARLRGLRSDLIDPAIAAHHGRIVKRTGDGSIIEFRSIVDAVRCAIEVQTGMVARTDLLQMQDEVVTRLARAMDIQLPEAEAARLKRAPAANPDAEDLALQCVAADISARTPMRDPVFAKRRFRSIPTTFAP